MIEVGLGASLSRSLIVSLAADCGTAAELARLVAERPGGTIDANSITFASRSALARVAADFVRRSWLTIIPTGWRVGPVVIPQGVVSFLEGAAAMRANDPDKETSIAVVTMPPSPSAIATALPQTGLAHASLVSTRDALESVVETASDLTAAGILAFDYTLDAVGGFETFHAKVALADSELAYVGSANMTMFARHSMELGVVVEGRAARVIANVIRAVVRVARPIPLV